MRRDRDEEPAQTVVVIVPAEAPVYYPVVLGRGHSRAHARHRHGHKPHPGSVRIGHPSRPALRHVGAGRYPRAGRH